MAKSKSPNKRQGTPCDPIPEKKISRLQPAVGQPLHRKPRVADLKKAGA